MIVINSPAESADQLFAVLRRSAQKLFDRRSIRDLELVLSQLVSAAVDAVPGAAGGGISRTESGTVRSSHATDGTISALDQCQSELNEGPCITAADEPPESGMILADDLAGADGERWPRFAPHAVEAGYRSMLSTHLATRPGGPRSALNLYAVEPHAFGPEAFSTAGVFALQAAALLYGADEAHMLEKALNSRDVIGRAKGILMERFTVGDAEAFQMLVSSSQETNIKLTAVADWLCTEAEQRQRNAAAVGGHRERSR